MYKDLGYAKYNKEDVIWRIVEDNNDGTVDICIDDFQGDITICFVNKLELYLVEKKEYVKRNKLLKKKYMKYFS